MPHWTFFRRGGDPRVPGPDWAVVTADDAFWPAIREAFPGVDGRGVTVRSCALDFYARPSRLCEVIRADEPRPGYALVYGTGEPGSCACRRLDATTDILTLNRQAGLALDDRNVVDYLYFWLAHQPHPDGRFVPVERLEQVRWRCRPREGDLALLGRHVRPVGVVPYRSTGSYELALRVLRGDILLDMEFTVSSFGHVQYVRRRPLLWSLPVVNDDLADRADAEPRFCAASGDECIDAQQAPDVLECFARILPPDSRRPELLLSRALPFLPETRLYRGIYEGAEPGRPRAADDPAGAGLFVIKGREHLYPIEGTSAPLIVVRNNERFALCRPGAADLDESYVLEYLGFFCHMLCGDEGPFHVLEEVCDLNVLRPPAAERGRRRSGTGRNYDRFMLDEIGAFTRPLSLVERKAGEVTADGCVQYGGALFGAKFTVGASGHVHMDGDSPAVDALPVNWVRNTLPRRRRGEVPYQV